MSDGTSSIEYRIKTTADVRGLQDVAKGLTDQIKLAKEAGRSAETFEKELNKVNAALNTQSGKLGQEAAALEKTIAVMSKAGMKVDGLATIRDSILKSAGLEKTRDESAHRAAVAAETQSRKSQIPGVSASDLQQSVDYRKPGRFKQAGSAFADAGGGLAGLRAGAAVFGTAATAGLAALTAALVGGAKAVNEYAEAEKRVGELDGALAQRGKLTDDYRRSLQDLAQTLQEQTGRESSEWIEALTKLTQFGADESNINKQVEAVKNLAGLLGGDLATAAMMVGKANNGSFDSFSRLGIAFDDQASKVKNLEKLYAELAARGGGQLAAQNQTLIGSFKQLGNSSADLLQNVGGVISRTLHLQQVVAGAANAISWLGNIFSATIPQSKGLKNATVETSAAMESAEEIAKRYAKSLERVQANAANVTKESERALVAIRAQAEQEKAIAQKGAKVILDQIDADEKSGKLKPLEAARKRELANKQLVEWDRKHEHDTKLKEAARLAQTEEVLRKQVDEANRNRVDQEAKVEETKRLSKKRALLMESRNLAEELYKKAPSEDRNYARSKRADARYALNKFDEQHGALDITTEEERAKQSRETAKKINAEIYPQLTEISARKIALQKEDQMEGRSQFYERQSERLSRLDALKSAREKQRGDFSRGEDGTITGAPEAVAFQRQLDQTKAFAPTVAKGSTAERRILAQKDEEIKRLATFIEALASNERLSRTMDAQLKRALDRIAILENQVKNR